MGRNRKGTTGQLYVAVKMDTSIKRNVRDKITKSGTQGMRKKACSAYETNGPGDTRQAGSEKQSQY